MAGTTTTTAAYLLKKLYAGKMPESLATRDHVFSTLIRKEDGFTGDGTFNYPLEHANPQSVGATFATAQTNVGQSAGVKVALTRPVYYGFGQMDGDLIAATKNDEGAFARALRRETDNMFTEMGNKTAIYLQGDGSGCIGQRKSASTNVITLVNADDAKYFKFGQFIEACDTRTGGTRRVGSTYVTAVDYDAGTVTLNSAAGITSFADNDFLYNAGDYDGVIKGLAAWIPLTAPSATLFFSMDRSVNPTLLGGNRLNATSNSIEENAITLATKIASIFGRGADTGLLAPVNFAALTKALGSKVQRGEGGTATFGFAYIEQDTPVGTIKWYSDPDVSSTLGYILNIKTWFIKHMEGFPHMINDDGNMSLRNTSSDGIGWRGRQWAQLGCTAPGRNGVFAI